MPVEGSNKKSTGSGPRFTKIGGAPSGFKKVGVAVQTSESASEEKAVETTQKVASAAEKKAQEEQDQLVQLLKQQEEVQKKIAQLKAEKEAKAKADAQAQAQAQAKASEVPIVQTPPPAEKALSDDPTRIEVEDITMGGTEDTVFAVQTYHEEPKMDVDDGEDEEDDEESITWERYDFTKPTDCDHKTCLGCKTDGIWDDNLLAT